MNTLGGYFRQVNSLFIHKEHRDYFSSFEALQSEILMQRVSIRLEGKLLLMEKSAAEILAFYNNVTQPLQHREQHCPVGLPARVEMVSICLVQHVANVTEQLILMLVWLVAPTLISRSN